MSATAAIELCPSLPLTSAHYGTGCAKIFHDDFDSRTAVRHSWYPEKLFLNYPSLHGIRDSVSNMFIQLIDAG